MSTGSIIPPDIREKMGREPPRGVGASAPENVAAAQRAAAITPEVPDEEPAELATDGDVPAVRVKCPNGECKFEVMDTWNFCPLCRVDLLRGGAEARIGVKFTEEDLSDYLFKGLITREIKIIGKHTATMKSSQPKDLEAIDNYIMNGDWAKDSSGADRKISDFYMRQVNAMCMTATCVVKIDGESLGETLEDKMGWLLERGSAFVDRLSQKVSLFNQALTEFLTKEDNVLGS